MRGGSWIFRLSDTNSSVAASAQVVQQAKRRRGLTGLMTGAGGCGARTKMGATLVMHRAMGKATVRMEDGDVELEGGVDHGV